MRYKQVGASKEVKLHGHNCLILSVLGTEEVFCPVCIKWLGEWNKIRRSRRRH